MSMSRLAVRGAQNKCGPNWQPLQRATNICTTSHVKVSDQVKHFGWLAKAKLHCKAGISLTCMNLIRGTNNLGWEKYHCSIVGDAWLLHIMYSYN